MSTTNSPGERVARWREQYQDVKWDVVDTTQPRNQALGAACENALDALEAGDPAEASTWIGLGQLISFKYRRVA